MYFFTLYIVNYALLRIVNLPTPTYPRTAFYPYQIEEKIVLIQ